VLAYSPIASDARVQRQIGFLSRRYAVTALGNDEVKLHLPRPKLFSRDCAERLLRKVRRPAVLAAGRLLPTWAYERWYWRETRYGVGLAPALRAKPDVIHANDWNTLPVAVRAAEATGARVVLDLHEYAPGEWEERRLWRAAYRPLIDHVLRTYAPRAAASVTVNEAIAERYRREYGLDPLVVMNAPACGDPVDFRPTRAGRIQLVHHGAAIRERRLELMVQAVAAADPRYSLRMVLLDSDEEYIRSLRSLAERVAPGRVEFRPAVAPERIVAMLSDCDMGIYLLPPSNVNHEAALPNKFFDFVAAGLAVCIGPSREMARLATHYGFGAAAPSFRPEDVAAVLNGLQAADIDALKRRALEARKTLNAEVEMAKLLALYATLLGTA
jgi:hypothetical protein